MPQPDGTILVVEDHAQAREQLVELLRKDGYQVESAADGKQALDWSRKKRFDVVLTDIRMGETDGFAVLQEFKTISPDTSIVLLTAFGSMEGAIEAVRRGAYDYLAKPFKPAELRMVVQRGLEHSRLLRENARFREELRERQDRSALVGRSAPMLELYTFIARVSATKSTVLLEGESGTGKELVARAIHSNSPRRERAFVPVNCAALPETLLESELFGHEKGAFTGAVGLKKGLFEAAHDGTIFLDEIGDIGPALQAKLLRVIQEQEFRRVGGTAPIKVDVRVIAATNQDINALVRDGRFREDLFYRLNVLRTVLPPLRDRREDIPLLAHHFLQHYAPASETQPIRGFTTETMALLERYHWPGNVRELENVVERTVSLARGPLVTPTDLPDEIRGTVLDAELQAAGVVEPGGGFVTLEEMEKRYLLRVLRETGGNKMKAAKVLGIDRRTLYRMAERFGLELGDDSSEMN